MKNLVIFQVVLAVEAFAAVLAFEGARDLVGLAVFGKFILAGECLVATRPLTAVRFFARVDGHDMSVHLVAETKAFVTMGAFVGSDVIVREGVFV